MISESNNRLEDEGNIIKRQERKTKEEQQRLSLVILNTVILELYKETRPKLEKALESTRKNMKKTKFLGIGSTVLGIGGTVLTLIPVTSAFGIYIAAAGFGGTVSTIISRGAIEVNTILKLKESVNAAYAKLEEFTVVLEKLGLKSLRLETNTMMDFIHLALCRESSMSGFGSFSNILVMFKELINELPQLEKLKEISEEELIETMTSLYEVHIKEETEESKKKAKKEQEKAEKKKAKEEKERLKLIEKERIKAEKEKKKGKPGKPGNISTPIEKNDKGAVNEKPNPTKETQYPVSNFEKENVSTVTDSSPPYLIPSENQEKEGAKLPEVEKELNSDQKIKEKEKKKRHSELSEPGSILVIENTMFRGGRLLAQEMLGLLFTGLQYTLTIIDGIEMLRGKQDKIVGEVKKVIDAVDKLILQLFLLALLLVSMFTLENSD